MVMFELLDSVHLVWIVSPMAFFLWYHEVGDWILALQGVGGDRGLAGQG